MLCRRLRKERPTLQHSLLPLAWMLNWPCGELRLACTPPAPFTYSCYAAAALPVYCPRPPLALLPVLTLATSALCTCVVRTYLPDHKHLFTNVGLQTLGQRGPKEMTRRQIRQ